MSLTRDQWIEMWEAIKRIEYNLNRRKLPPRQLDINIIKDKIQEVIGQME